MMHITHIWTRTRELWQYRHEPEHLRRLVNMYWNILLILAACTVVGSVLYGGGKFLAVLRSGEDSPSLSSGGGGIVLNRVELQATLDEFAARRAQYEFLTENPPAIADPSR